MKDSVLSLSQQLRSNVPARWLSAIAASRCIRTELPSARLCELSLTPHGFSVEFLYEGELDPSWIPLIERHCEQLPEIKRTHRMIASNAAQWLRSQGSGSLADLLAARGKEEVNVVEWADGRVDWLPDSEMRQVANADQEFVWALVGMEQVPDDDHPRWLRVMLEGVTASSLDRLRRLEKLTKTFNEKLAAQQPPVEGALLGGAARRVQQLWAAWAEGPVKLALLSPGLSQLDSVEELAEGWVRSNTSQHEVDSGTRLPALGAIGCWSVEAGEVWGDLRWEVADSADQGVMTDWLQSVQERLKLLGFECEIVAHFNPIAPSKAGDVAFREAAQWLRGWAKARSVEWVVAQGFDTAHGSNSWGGPSLEWRVFDPLGASWPFARLGVGVDVQAAWVKHWRRHFNRRMQRDATQVEQRAARLQDGRWLIASLCVDAEQEAKLTQIWQAWKAKSSGSR